MVIPGIVAVQTNSFTNYENAQKEMAVLNEQLKGIENEWYSNDHLPDEIAMIIICDDAAFFAADFNNFLWATFTRCNPSHDIHGISSFIKNKHWGCNGPLVIDARIKPHHAPVIEKNAKVEKNIEKYFNKGGSLYGI